MTRRSGSDALGRSGPDLARLEREVARILTALGRTGARRVDPAALQPAEVLLDLYGEDIRARAFVTSDEGAEMMLRPDLTVPIARMHMDAGGGEARYAYCGTVWRRQEAGSERPREYLQAGIEVFGGDAAQADAEVLGLVLRALGAAPVEIVTGDMGLLLAAVDALRTTERRRAALRRHIWRPARFQALLSRFGPDHAAIADARADVVAAVRGGRVEEMVAAAGAPVGLRDPADVVLRAARLAAEAAEPPLSQEAVDGLGAILAVTGSCATALSDLRVIARDVPGLPAAVDRFARRLDVFSGRGIAPDGLRFEASFGRTTLEYYDGFVFGALAASRSDLPPIASGGRYDALTAALGGGRQMPAVGGILRPEALLALEGPPAP